MIEAEAAIERLENEKLKWKRANSSQIKSHALALKKEKSKQKEMQSQIDTLQAELDEKVKENRLHAVQIKRMM